MFPRDLVLKEIFRPQSDSLHLLAPHIGKNPEAIVEMANKDQLSLWRDVVSRSEAVDRRTMAKLFYYHTPRKGPLMEYFRAHSNVIHLIRRNIFDVYVSTMIARRTGQWQLVGDHTPAVEPEPFEIIRAEFEDFRCTRMNDISLTREFFSGSPNYHEIFYEDICDRPEDCRQVIGEIFGVNAASEISTQQRKQKSTPNSALITNYSEVADLDCPISWSV
ncbi:hypothetical protein GCM10010991_15290 [Gemmobacter aquaticus]|uniref:Sulfotransferase family protein n=1 Tax=Gemmobacter aquaticus TaxID=490185 RepID=A0A918DC63_9RHOB|nr:hypothetical protein [Gemmobacter aquaticus]GGO30437.1 hypothetical protein GCM10010991_15290 [Gemmobacter aquaticus]